VKILLLKLVPELGKLKIEIFWLPALLPIFDNHFYKQIK